MNPADGKEGAMTSALVVGSGPNGLSAGITLAQAGVDVTLVESGAVLGGGLRSGEQTLPGLVHDHCAAIVPTAVASPFMQSLDLQAHGVRWAWPEIDLVHPLDNGRAGALYRSLDQTVAGLGADGPRWRRLFDWLSESYDQISGDLLSPMLKIPDHPVKMAIFGMPAMVPASLLGRIFETPAARALFVGNAAHTWVPLNRPPTSALALMFGGVAHRYGWPCVVGGTERLAEGLAGILRSLGGRLETGVEICDVAQLNGYDLVFFDTGPRLPLRLLAGRMPWRVRRALSGHRYGPAAFKLDIAVHEGIPWTNLAARNAGTLHVCGSAREVALAERETSHGRMPERPFIIVGQQAVMDASRGASGLVPIYAYAHVPHSYSGDATEAILGQVERFAPGFRSRIAGLRVHTPADIERDNSNNVGGDINGGAMDLAAFIARPRLAVDPYWLGVGGNYICSASTPPGGGVHGMCGHLAARAALRRLRR